MWTVGSYCDPDTYRFSSHDYQPRYSCCSSPKQIGWWDHQIGHLPCSPCSFPRRQPAEWGRSLALLSDCIRYSRLLMGMLALLPSSREIDTMTHPNFSALTALQCIPASLRAHAVAQVLKYWHLSFACTKETCLVSVAVTLFSCFRRHPFLHSVFTYCTRQVH